MIPRHAVAFLAGIVVVECCDQLEEITRAAPLLVLAVVGFAVLRPRLVATCAAGVLWAWCRALLLLDHQQLPSDWETVDRVIVGDVVSLPKFTAGQSQFEFVPESAAGLPSRLQLTWYESQPAPRAAERWQLKVRLRSPRGFANPGGHDYEGSLFREGIGATGYVRAAPQNRSLADRRAAHPVLWLRALISEEIERAVGGAPAGRIVAGLAVGATERISAHQWQVFAATGTTHLIAISGLHVTMVAALAMVLTRALWTLPRLRRPKTNRSDLACLCGAATAGIYSLLAGFSVPTQRTLVMLLVALGATWLRRYQPASHVLALALIGVLLVDPHAALAPGFWLSFLAVAAILAMIGSVVGERRHAREFFVTQGVVSAALLPATLLLFGSVSLIAPAVNLLAIPVFSAVLVPVTLLGTALLWATPAMSDTCFRIAAMGIDLLWPVLEWTAALPGATAYLAAPALWLSAVLVLTTLMLLAPLPWRLRVPGLLLLAPLLVSTPERPAAGDFALTVLDVGQGLSIVLRTHAHTLLFDAGPRFRNGRSAGELAVVPYLRHEGIRDIDLLVVSHADADHIGGAPAIEQAISVREIRHGGAAPSLNAPAAACARGEAWMWDGVRFEFLHPGSRERWSKNDGSCVLAISAGPLRVLLTGDIEHGAERRIRDLGSWGKADVVVVPHHGSRSSSAPELIRAAAAQYAIVSAGAYNRWRFPHPDVVERWCNAGTNVIDTANWGAITVPFNSGIGMEQPRSYRADHRRFWHSRTPLAGQSLCS